MSESDYRFGEPKGGRDYCSCQVGQDQGYRRFKFDLLQIIHSQRSLQPTDPLAQTSIDVAVTIEDKTIHCIQKVYRGKLK